MDKIIQDFIKYITHEKRMSKHTIISYQTDLKQFSAFLTKSKVSNISEVDHYTIRAWIVGLKDKEVGNRTINRKLSTLKSFYKYLIKKEKLDNNPMLKIIAPKIDKKLPVFFNNNQMIKLFNIFDEEEKHFSSLRDRLVLELLYGTGIRLSELIEIKKIEVTDKEVKVLGKRNKERLVTITPSITKALKAYLKERDKKQFNSDYLLLTDRGNKMYPKFVYRLVNKYIRLVSSEKKRSPHTLRHSFATNVLNEGAKLHVIKEALGHSNLSATEVYTHNSISRLKEVYKKFHPKENNN